MDFWSKSHGLWIELAWTLGRMRMGFGAMSHALWMDMHGLRTEVAHALGGGARGFELLAQGLGRDRMSPAMARIGLGMESHVVLEGAARTLSCGE